MKMRTGYWLWGEQSDHPSAVSKGYGKGARIVTTGHYLGRSVVGSAI